MKPRKDSTSLSTQTHHHSHSTHHRILIDKANEMVFDSPGPSSRSFVGGFNPWGSSGRGSSGSRERDEYSMDGKKRELRDHFKMIPTRLTPTNLLILTLLITSYYLGHLTSSPRSGTSAPKLRKSNKFHVPASKFVAPRPYPPTHYPAPLTPELPSGLTSLFSRKHPNRIPNVVHYVYGLKPTSAQQDSGIKVDESTGEFEPGQGGDGESFPYYAYLAVRSVLVNVKPEKVYFHHFNTPTGPWFELLRPHLTLIDARVPTRIFGNELRHFAHRSDVIRLDALLATGGIYLDIDTYVIRPFEEFMDQSVVLGMEAATDSNRHILDPEGLCNGIILAEPRASFLERWRASYEDFKPDEWAQHSVARPWEIARRHPHEVTVLDTRAFFWPGWWGNDVQMVHETDDYDFHASGQYAYHAWESLAMKYLKKLDPVMIKTNGTSFNKMVRPFVGPTDEAVYAELTRTK